MYEKAKGKKRLAMVASKGTLDMAYPPLILASAAVSMGWECGIFFTFYGLDVLNKGKLKALKVPPLGNPAMPVPVPNVIGALPGMTTMATKMMRRWMHKAKMPTVQELIDIVVDGGAVLFACTTTMGIMGIEKEDLIEEAKLAGAATFLEYASEADVSLFI